MADVLIPQNHTEKLPRMCAEPNHIASPRSHELLTEKVVRRCIRVLLQEEGFVHERIFDTIDPSEGRQGEVGKLVEGVADKVKAILNDPHHPKPPSLRDITHDQWNIHIGNVHSEYVRVAQIIFKDTVVTWGRVVALIGFSANYCLYAIEQGVMETIVESVCGWAVSFMERELSDWFQQNSWEQFMAFADKAIMASRTRNEHPVVTPWQSIATIGAIGGTAAALMFLFRNAFS